MSDAGDKRATFVVQHLLRNSVAQQMLSVISRTCVIARTNAYKIVGN